MRIITCNINGIRSGVKKGFFEWINTLDIAPDFICLQETKAHLENLDSPELNTFKKKYSGFYHDAIKPGYSGTVIYTPHKPLHVHTKLGFTCADTEGRFVEVEYKNLSVVSVYFPSGSSGEARQAQKFIFMEKFTEFLIKNSHKNMIIAGDWNIAHKNSDLKNWRGNQKNSGFLPPERAWLDKVFDELGWIDAFRHVNPLPDQYTWWSNRGQAYAKNVGWRIDYQVISPGLKQAIESVEIYKNQRFSDHAPVIMDYNEAVRI